MADSMHYFYISFEIFIGILQIRWLKVHVKDYCIGDFSSRSFKSHAL